MSAFDLDADAIAETAKLIEDDGNRCAHFALDVRNEDAVVRAVNASIERYGPVRVLVCAAGISRATKFMDMTVSTWTEMLEIHATGAFICTRAVASSMVDAGFGRIIYIASRAGLSANPGSVHYGAAKAAMINLGRGLAKELGPSGISVNSIAPGAIDTPMLRLIPDHIRRTAVDNPIGRVGRPYDVARAVLFLSEDTADFITGQVLSVNGGSHI